jgi:glycosyltransferase involved in cell wall biosynthesis
MTRVSIVITCYNLGEYLEEALSSALAQTYSDFEVLLIDDGSTDAQTITLLDHLPQHPRLRMLRTGNQGVARARNTAIAAACGDYILPLDADDRIMPGYLTCAVAVLNQRPEVGFVGCHYRLFEENHSTYTPTHYQLPDLLVENVVPVTSLFRRSAWKQVGGYYPEIAIEDWDFWLSLIEYGYIGSVIPEVLFERRMRASSRYGHNQQPDVYQRTLALLYQRHRRLYDAYIYEVLSRKDLEYAKALTYGAWLEQQGRQWQQMAEQHAHTLKSLGARTRLSEHPWSVRQLARWRRVRDENRTVIGRVRALLAGLGRVAYRKWRLIRHS